MSGAGGPERLVVGLDDVLVTEELERRPSRPPDHAAESRALGALVEGLAQAPRAILQQLVDAALLLCRADSAGISILETAAEPDGDGDGDGEERREVFRWHAAAGRFRAIAGGTIARDASPCGVVLDRNDVLLFAYPERHFAYLAAVDSPLVEALLVPFHVAGVPVGTVWVVAHSAERKFDAEDARVLTGLSRFASAAYQLVRALDAAEAVRNELERRVGERTRELSVAHEALRESETRLRAVDDVVLNLLWQNDPDGRVVWYNRRWFEYTGRTPDQTLGFGWIDALHPDDREPSLLAYTQAIRTGQPLRLEYRIRRADDGEYRWFLVQAVPMRNQAGGITTWFGSATNMHDQRTAMEALRASEERLRLIVASATEYAIFTLDADRRITSWSPGAELIFGYAEAEVLGTSGDRLYLPAEQAAGLPEHDARTAERAGRMAEERWHVRKDGSAFYASGVLTWLDSGGLRGYARVVRDLTDRKRMEDALREARDALEARVIERTAELTRANNARVELLRRLVTAQEDERRRVSRELHDGLGQELTALILGLKGLEAAVPPGTPGRERLREVEAIVGRIGREAHDLAVELRPTALDDIGLGPALTAYVARWAERAGTTVEIQTHGLEGDRLPPEVETTVYRVVQEALNNVAKHAGARRVSVIVERRRDEVTALVEDDGRGFDPERTSPQPDPRLGVLGMQERLALVGGSLLVDSGEGQGTTVRARIPLNHSNPPGAANHGR
jgi:PAS domain S-box-containing protein